MKFFRTKFFRLLLVSCFILGISTVALADKIETDSRWYGSEVIYGKYGEIILPVALNERGEIITGESSASDFFIEVAKGNIEGHSIVNVAGNNYDLNGTPETIWDFGGNIVYLTEDTLLYASSSSGSDTGVLLLATGLDDTYTAVQRTVTTNGQNQVALSGDMFRIFSVAVIGTTLNIGDIYIASADTLSSGVPDTDSKVQSMIVAGNGITRNGFYTIPDGHTGYLLKLRANVGKLDDAIISPSIRYVGGVFLSLVDWYLFQLFVEMDMGTSGIFFPAGTDLELRGTSTNNSSAHAAADILLIEDED